MVMVMVMTEERISLDPDAVIIVATSGEREHLLNEKATSNQKTKKTTTELCSDDGPAHNVVKLPNPWLICE